MDILVSFSLKSPQFSFSPRNFTLGSESAKHVSRKSCNVLLLGYDSSSSADILRHTEQRLVPADQCKTEIDDVAGKTCSDYAEQDICVGSTYANPTANSCHVSMSEAASYVNVVPATPHVHVHVRVHVYQIKFD